MSGRTPIYNFDEWSKAHYGVIFERGNRAKVKNEIKRMKLERNEIDIKNETIIMGFIILFVSVIYFSYSKETFDTDIVRNDTKIDN